jgi:hypothetical protein
MDTVGKVSVPALEKILCEVGTGTWMVATGRPHVASARNMTSARVVASGRVWMGNSGCTPALLIDSDGVRTPNWGLMALGATSHGRRTALDILFGDSDTLDKWVPINLRHIRLVTVTPVFKFESARMAPTDFDELTAQLGWHQTMAADLERVQASSSSRSMGRVSGRTARTASQSPPVFAAGLGGRDPRCNVSPTGALPPQLGVADLWWPSGSQSFSRKARGQISVRPGSTCPEVFSLSCISVPHFLNINSAVTTGEGLCRSIRNTKSNSRCSIR